MFPFFLQAVQKIHLADHIHSLTELLHADALQQLEVALLRSLVANLIDILSASLQSMSSMQHQAVPLQPSVTTSMSPSPPPSLLWVLPTLKSQLKPQPLQVGVWQPHLSCRRHQHHPSTSTYFQHQFQPKLKGLTVHPAHSLLVPLLICPLLWFLS